VAATWLRFAVALVFLFAPTAARAAAVQIAVVADEGCPSALRDRIAEQIADVADRIDWSCLSRLDADEPFHAPDTGPDVLQVWVDVTRGIEARLTVRASGPDRFVVRRIALPRGMDEVGREEIGQIVRSAAIAILAGPAETLSRDQARAAISQWTEPRAGAQAPSPVPPRAEPLVEIRSGPVPSERPHRGLQVGLFVSARAFATPIPIVEGIGVASAFGRPGAVGAWVEVEYQLQARDNGNPVGVSLDAVAARAGLAASVALGRSWAAHLGAGVGLTRTWFTPLGDAATVTTAPPGSFTSVAGRIIAGADVRVGRRALAGVTVFCDAAGADVHYDLHEADGGTRRVLAPFRLQPGVAVRIGWGP
jgi:hypothetical protein